ncbi:MAG: hypothetical protein DSY55_04335 [Clostridia bacterium]|nr:MAG: hypothetical protein DSY55_04335 [Clostridia bacterium]
MNAAFSEFKPVLKVPAFKRLWLAQLFSLTAQNGIHFVQLVLIERLTGHSLQIGFMIAAFSLPPVIFSFVAGMVVDRIPKKWIIISANLFRGLLAISYIFTLIWFKNAPTALLLLIYTITFLGSSAGSFYNPAMLSTLPLLVKEDQLIVANSLFNFTIAVAQLGGLIILAPAAVKLLGLAGAFALMGLFYILAFILVLKLPRDYGHKSMRSMASASRMWREVREGWVFVARHRDVYLSVIQLTLVSSLMMILAMIAPGFSVRVLGMAPEDAVLVFAPAGIGMVAAIYGLTRFASRFSVPKLQSYMLFLAAAAFGAISYISFDYTSFSKTEQIGSRQISIAVLMVATAVAFLGFALYVINTVAQTTLQKSTPETLRGRVFTVQFMMASLVGLGPLLVAATLADLIGIPAMLFWLSVGCLLVGAVSIYDAYRNG